MLFYMVIKIVVMNVVSHRSHAATVQQKLRHQRRANGMRPVQIWAPDTRRPEFAEECRRQARNVAAHVPANAR